jgi:hypothetical protein
MGPEQPRQPSHKDTAADSLAALEQSTGIHLGKEPEANSNGLRCRICGQEGSVAPSSWPES